MLQSGCQLPLVQIAFADAAVLSGLEVSAVTRMHQTLEQAGDAARLEVDKLHQVFVETGRYKGYREAIAAVGDDEPFVPHLAVHLSDLTVMEDGSPDTLPERPAHINFSKWHMVASVVDLLASCQQRHYQIKPLRRVIGCLHREFRPHFHYFDEDRDRVTKQLESLSMQQEP